MAITLTETAAARVRAFLTRRGKGEGLRLGIKTVGCSGKAYVIDYADAIDPRDHIFECRGIKVVVDEGSLPFLDGTEVDFTRDGMNERFTFNNPNVKGQCGCGESFSV